MELGDLLSLLWRGGKTTLIATVWVGAIALPVSFVAGTVRSLSPSRLLRGVIGIYVEVFRGTSAIVQLFWVFFVLPSLGVELSPFVSGVLVLGLNAGAYGSEIVRGALRGVGRGQSEAAATVNLSRLQELRYVLLPQAIPITIPPFESLAIEAFKATSLLSLISVADLTYEINVMAINGRLDFVPSYMILMVAYLVLSIPVSNIGRVVDATYGRRWRFPNRRRRRQRATS